MIKSIATTKIVLCSFKFLLLNVYSPFSFLASGEEFAQTLEPPLLPLSRLFSAKSAATREVDYTEGVPGPKKRVTGSTHFPGF